MSVRFHFAALLVVCLGLSPLGCGKQKDPGDPPVGNKTNAVAAGHQGEKTDKAAPVAGPNEAAAAKASRAAPVLNDPAEDPELRKHVEYCVFAMSNIAGARADRRGQLLASKCPFACPGLEEIGGDDGSRRLPGGEKCGFYCSASAKAAFEASNHDWAVLVDRCGADYYDLPVDAVPYFDLGWFAYERIGKWLGKAAAHLADSQLTASIDSAMEELHLPLAGNSVPPRDARLTRDGVELVPAP